MDIGSNVLLELVAASEIARSVIVISYPLTTLRTEFLLLFTAEQVAIPTEAQCKKGSEHNGNNYR
jgi:hypothetical protein